MPSQHPLRLIAIGVFTALLVSLSVPAQADAAAPLVVIDPGHGGRYSNANANGLMEKRVNLQIALELRTQLQAKGYRVAMTRTSDREVTRSDVRTWNYNASTERWAYALDGRTGIYNGIPKDDLQARVDIANRAGADLFISIHNNGSASRSARGTETFAAGRDRLGRQVAALVHRRIVARTGLRDRGVGTADFYVCRWADMPAILVEGAFITNPSDAYLLKQSWFRRRMAVGIAEGVDAWFDSKPITATKRSVTTTSAIPAAVAVSRSRFATEAATVVIGRADRWQDAASLPAFAARAKAPLLWMIGREGLAPSTAAELARLKPQRVVLVGVKGSFDESSAALVAAASSLPTSAVESIQAPDRATLAASIATSMSPVATNVFIVDSDSPAALLAAAPAAAARRAPILLAVDGALPAQAKAFLEANRSTIKTASLVGPSASVPTRLATGIPTVKRYDGVDLAAKAQSVAAGHYRSTARDSMSVVVADGRHPASYLTAAYYASRSSQPVLVVSARVLPAYSRLWITNRRSQIRGFEVFDGRRTIPRLMEHNLRKADHN